MGGRELCHTDMTIVSPTVTSVAADTQRRRGGPAVRRRGARIRRGPPFSGERSRIASVLRHSAADRRPAALYLANARRVRGQGWRGVAEVAGVVTEGHRGRGSDDRGSQRSREGD